MDTDGLDISSLLAWDDGLPHPMWDFIGPWLSSRFNPGEEREGWVAVCRQWLAELASALGPEYGVVESAHFLVLASQEHAAGGALLRAAETGRAKIASVVGSLADFDAPGKQIVLAIRQRDDYYRYLSRYHSEGEHGTSGGVHIRAGHPHVVVWGTLLGALEGALVHELTHAALHHLADPQWLEEGLAQMFAHATTGTELRVNAEVAAEHEEYWREHGLESFWRGTGFSSPGEVQHLCYQLAEILVRLLVSDAQPRWFGLVRKPLRRFTAFLWEAEAGDCGEAACREHLGYGLGDLAGRFLGPGPWSTGGAGRLPLWREGGAGEE